MNSYKQGFLFFYATIIISQFFSCSNQTKQPVSYVDPFICTEGDHGHWHPSALVPFGLVKLGPDTYPGSLTADGDFAHSGYNYSDSIVRGFSHFHKGSSGGGSISDRAGRLSIMPFSHESTNTFLLNPLAAINKKSEKAAPGYYSVEMTDDNILVELTTTAHVGIHCYTFPEGKIARIFLNEGNKNRSSLISVHRVDDWHIEGFQETFSGVHFVVEFNRPMVSCSAWNGKEFSYEDSIDQQPNGGLICDFGDLEGEPLMIKVGVSLTSLNAAKNNLHTECADWDFVNIKQRNSDLWNSKLSQVIVEGDNEYKTIFYTALYHTCFFARGVERCYRNISGIGPAGS